MIGFAYKKKKKTPSAEGVGIGCLFARDGRFWCNSVALGDEINKSLGGIS